jgi:hypothetical protein
MGRNRIDHRLMVGWMNDRRRHLALPSFPQYDDSLTGMLHINGCKLKSLLLESAAASSFASLPAYLNTTKSTRMLLRLTLMRQNSAACVVPIQTMNVRRGG